LKPDAVVVQLRDVVRLAEGEFGGEAEGFGDVPNEVREDRPVGRDLRRRKIGVVRIVDRVANVRNG
jgi:hypothetical protein